MKKTIWLIFVSIFILLSFTACFEKDNDEGTPPPRDTTPTEGIVYQISYEGKYAEASVTGYSGNATDVVIAPYFNNILVTKIEDYAFKNKNITSIDIPPEVKEIGYGAFLGCYSLSKVYISDIDKWCQTTLHSSPLEYADYLYVNDTLIEDVNVSYNVERLYEYSLNCKNIKKVTITNGFGLEVIEQNAFSESLIEWVDGVGYVDTWVIDIKSDLEEAVIRDRTYGIAQNAFYNATELKKLTLPSSVKRACAGFLSRCAKLEYLTYPCLYDLYHSNVYFEKDSYGNITHANYYDDDPFSACFGYDFDADDYRYYLYPWGEDGTSINIYTNGYHTTSHLSYPSSTSYHGYSTVYCTNYIKYDIPNNLKQIVFLDTYVPTGYFANIPSLEFIDISTVKSIKSYAFYGCSNLSSIVIPESVTTIGKHAFGGCSNLTIYCEAESKPEGWDDDWNSSNCTVIWGYKG